MNKQNQKILFFLIGVLFIIILFITAIIQPDPTNFQEIVFRTILSLGGGAFVALAPGFLEIEVKGIVKAGGALAAFLIIYIFNPTGSNLSIKAGDNSIIINGPDSRASFETNNYHK